MAEEKKQEEQKKPYEKPKGAEKEFSIVLNGEELKYKVKCDWMVLQKDEKPFGEMFYTYYSSGEEKSKRPITFAFNGGPGSASVYLHLGAMGPKRVNLCPEGYPLDPPHRLVDNQESWLQFTDLVFIDPIGTGFSRVIKDPKGDEKKDKENKDNYWGITRDLESICEFIKKILSKNNRWNSPVYIAGESYGGYRIGKLVNMLQDKYAVGLSGSIIISPALDLTNLNYTYYNALPWIDIFPTLAAIAAYHGKSKAFDETKETLYSFRKRAGEFAISTLSSVIIGDELIDADYREAVYNQITAFTGIPLEEVQNRHGKLDLEFFSKNLLKDERKVIGLYDGSMTIDDVFAESHELQEPIPSTRHTPVFGTGINYLLCQELGLETERNYNMINFEANSGWKMDVLEHPLHLSVESVDDLRIGMGIGSSMGVYLTHGIFDQVTPSFSAERITALMKLTDKQKEKLTIRHFKGGHMFYTWEESRVGFFKDMQKFYEKFSH